MDGTKEEPERDATELLLGTSAGDVRALDELVPLIYHELRALAAHHLRKERPEHSLQPTALVHELYLRLIDQSQVEWQNRAHFLGIAARTMRNILVDHARRRSRHKRDGGRRTSVELAVEDIRANMDIVALDEALDRLDAKQPIKRQIVELRFFGGLTIDETAEALEISPGSVKRHWTAARAWLYRELHG